MKKFIVTEDTILRDILENVENAEPILMGFGMHCLHCPCASMESLKEACESHEIDLNLVLEKLNNK